ncbi:DUF2793 domain-containing protein [uncultured Cohaesibacter sp.]|uniref:DUF2793 domain-containing protein n=1 Tax=uncultured Cohaesibacter sp. TaxID=1002546 RepID=UPI00292DDDFD|nr:DUF2793 domain-containing protein [uncultured Cohaesibacter sp.]
MEQTAILSLPYIAASQNQKHVTHNEALRMLDALVQLSVKDRHLTAPPEEPSEGDRYIVAEGGSDDWEGWDDSLAAYLDGVWTQFVPTVGWIAWAEDEEAILTYGAEGWVLFSDYVVESGVSTWGVNTSADETNRLSVKSDAVLFSHDDVTPGTGDSQLKINKAADTDTASLLFQTDWSGRAEMGLAGEDSFSFKVSPDGSNWFEGISIDKDSGAVTFPNSSIGGGVPKNYLINGDFDVSQRGTSFTIAAGSSAYTLDRWLVTNDTDQSVTVYQSDATPGSTNFPGNPRYKMQLAFDTAPTSGTIRIEQRVEYVQKLAEMTATARGYFYGPSGSETLAAEVVQNFGTGGSPSSEVTTAATSLDVATIYDADGMARSALFDVPSVSGMTYGSNGDDYLALAWVLTPRQADTYDIVHMSFVEGNASGDDDPFERRSPEDTVSECQRYYWRGYTDDQGLAYL